MTGKIIIGYPGIGKSTFCSKQVDYNFIDLESSNFHDGKEPEKWYCFYAMVAEDLAAQGFNVFVSSHYDVVMALKMLVSNPDIPVHVVCPSLELEKEWVEKLRNRYLESGLEKDRRAYGRAKSNYRDDISELLDCGFPVTQIENIDYDIFDVISNLEKGN